MSVRKIASLLTILSLLAFVACEEDEDNGPPENEGLSFEDVANGLGELRASDDTNFVIEGAATWEEQPDMNVGGLTYSVWKAEITATSGEVVEIRILEDQSTSQEEGPDSGEYVLGDGMDQNTITIFSLTNTFDPGISSEGSFSLSRGEPTDILLVSLDANGLGSGSIDGPEQTIDVEAVIKAEKK